MDARSVTALIAQPFDPVGSNTVVSITQRSRQRGGIGSLKLTADNEKVVAVGTGLDEWNAGELRQC
jgi:hypothetical protein